MKYKKVPSENAQCMFSVQLMLQAANVTLSVQPHADVINRQLVAKKASFIYIYTLPHSLPTHKNPKL